jgi:mRNA interferase RelE/StbE
VSYAVEIAPAARRQIKKLPNDIQKKVVEKLEELALEPRPDGVKKLEG